MATKPTTAKKNPEAAVGLPAVVIGDDSNRAARILEALASSGLRVLRWTPEEIRVESLGSKGNPADLEASETDVWWVEPAHAPLALAALEAMGPPGPRDRPVDPSLDGLEWAHIQRVLKECRGNISATARRLGIHRRSLQRKLAKAPPGR